MTFDTEKDVQAKKSVLAGRLIAATGITGPEADTLISTIGSDWSSLFREAKVLMRNR